MSDPWAAGALARLLHSDPDQPSAWLSSMVPVLVETAARWPHVAEEQLFPVVGENPRLLLLAGGGVLASFTELPTVPMNILEDIELLLPEGRGSDLAIGRAAVIEKLAEYRVAQTDDPAQQAAIYTNLRSALSDSGLYEKEAVVAAEVVRLYRGLARLHPAEFLMPLAIALDAYGTAHIMTGDVRGSIQAQAESVSIYRMLY